MTDNIQKLAEIDSDDQLSPSPPNQPLHNLDRSGDANAYPLRSAIGRNPGNSANLCGRWGCVTLVFAIWRLIPT